MGKAEGPASALSRAHPPLLPPCPRFPRCFCTLDVHPREAEELVTEACKSCEGLAPNDKTLRTLDKLWAAYEQTYG